MAEKVIVRRLDDYEDIDKIEGMIREGMQELDAKPAGRVLVKPNVVFAHRRYGREAYTDPAVLEALFRNLKNDSKIESVTLGERCAVTVPTRYLFRENGYVPLAKKYGVKCAYFDEDRKRRVHLKKGTVHRSLLFPESVLNADYRIWVPKLKNHVSSLLTCALKLNIGILDSKERLTHHDYLLEEKIADLFEVGRPDLIVVDAVTGGQRNELVPQPLFIGALIMGTNSVAVDAVCTRILGLEPGQVKHLDFAHRRGWGPVSLEEIDLRAEISLDELRERTKDLDRTFNDLRTMNLPIHLHLGNYPNGDDLCHTGCVNMLKAVFAIKEAHEPGSLARLKPFHVVVGEYEGDVVADGETVIVVGDCAKVSGKLEGKVVRVKGCPVPVPYFMLYACHYGKVRSPYLNPAAMFSLPYHALVSLAAKAKNRLAPRA